MIRILAFLEATTITGPAKNVLEFHRQLTSVSVPPIQLEVATFQRGDPDNAFTRALEAASIPLHRIPERSATDRSVLPKIRELISECRPDLIQTHAIKSHFLMRLSGEWKAHPWVAFHHGYTSTGRRLYLYNQLDRWSLRAAHHVVTVSRAFEKDLTRRGIAASRITVLHNAIDAAWGEQARDASLRSATRKKWGLSESDRALIIVGRLSTEKSHVVLIQALGRLRALVPETRVRLFIVGDGPEKPAIEQAARTAGCLDQVLFAGHADDVSPFYAAADIAVLSSKTEGSPNALLEAMAASIPVVATAVGGVPEIVTHRVTALLVPPSDEIRLASALAELLQHPVEGAAMASRARASILARYTPESRMLKLCSFYQDCIAEGRR